MSTNRMHNLPSVKTLEAAFPTKGKVLRKLLESPAAVLAHPAAIAREKECLHTPPLSILRLAALDAELGTFGVEYVSGNGTRQTPSFTYLNAGDTYNTTLVRFARGNYRVTDIGSIIERGNYA